MKIKAAVLHEMGSDRPYNIKKPIAIEEVNLDEPRGNEVLVRIRSAGLCHSDLSVINGSRPRVMPMVLGHEAAGEVVELGPEVKDLSVGDHVVFSFVPVCGECMKCLTGRVALCEHGGIANSHGTLLDGEIRLSGADGKIMHHHMGVSAFAEYAVVSRKSIVRIDKSLPFSIAALFGCAVMTGVGAVVNTSKMSLGDSVLITGMGGIGFAALLGAIAGGAGKIIVADINKEKLAKALELGADYAIDTSDDNALEYLQDITNGGVDIGFDFSGVISALEFTFSATGRGGQTVTAGLPHPDKRMQLSPTKLVGEERQLLGSYLGSCVPSRDIPAFINLYQKGKLPVEKLLTHRLKFDEINEGFERLAKGEAIRQIIEFS